MKILFFIENLGSGGKERRLVELIKNLSLTGNYQMELVLTKNKLHYEEIHNTGIKIHYVIRKSFKKDPRLFYKFYTIAKKFKPDILHTWGNLVTFYTIPTKILLNIPLLNNQVTDAPNYVSNSLIGPRTNFKFSNKIIANSYAGLKSYSAPKDKSIVIYNGFDFKRIKDLESTNSIREKFNIKTPKIVTMVASYSDKKDHETYLKVAKQILDKRKDVTFLAVGGGDKDRYLETIKGYEKYIKLIGKQSNVESIMNASEFGVLCTYTEGISNALLEFMSLKKPVLITGGGGCNELVENNVNGYLFNEKEVELLKQKIIILLDDEELRFNFGKRSREIVEEKFNIDGMMNSYKKLYDDIIATSKRK